LQEKRAALLIAEVAAEQQEATRKLELTKAYLGELQTQSVIFLKSIEDGMNLDQLRMLLNADNVEAKNEKVCSVLFFFSSPNHANLMDLI
jgi:hypothetical protein